MANVHGDRQLTPMRRHLRAREGVHVLRYRTDVVDADCVARITGYHLTALGLTAADSGGARTPNWGPP